MAGSKGRELGAFDGFRKGSTLRARITRSGCSGLTNANQSVMSAFWSRAVIGASRWLAAKAGGVGTASTAARMATDARSRVVVKRMETLLAGFGFAGFVKKSIFTRTYVAPAGSRCADGRK